MYVRSWVVIPDIKGIGSVGPAAAGGIIVVET